MQVADRQYLFDVEREVFGRRNGFFPLPGSATAPTPARIVSVPISALIASARSARQMPGRVEVALLRVLVRDHLRLRRPAYPEARVVPAHAALALRGVEGRDEVERLGILFERQEAVGKAAGHIHHSAVL